MIQLERSSNSSAEQAKFYLDIYDKMTSIVYRPLLQFVSEATGKSFVFLALATSFTKKERYVQFLIGIGADYIPLSGFITFGNTDLPYGFYDVTVYENSNNTNLDPSGLSVIWKGMGNLSATQSGTYKNPAVEYNEYSVNDSENELVYITAVPNN